MKQDKEMSLLHFSGLRKVKCLLHVPVCVQRHQGFLIWALVKRRVTFVGHHQPKKVENGKEMK